VQPGIIEQAGRCHGGRFVFWSIRSRAPAPSALSAAHALGSWIE